ncbi:hypothetical protein [Winogradskyella sp.]|uniref:hypothetical protein n=1 Tax=Winogradskyella sp. TaxID=1883156 RepID=UPI003BAB4E5C
MKKVKKLKSKKKKKRRRKGKPIAMGKIAADGSILKATPGISISTVIYEGEIYGTRDDIGYTVTLPEGLVCDNNYIIQLTAENYGEDGPDYVITSIASRYQTIRGFEVIIWADRIQTISSSYTITPVRTNWHFVVYDL